MAFFFCMFGQQKEGQAGMNALRFEIVDDTPIVRERLRELVQSIGSFTVVGEAGSPADAIAVFEREHPDVIILDMKLEGGTGIDVLQAIRKVNKDVRIIVWTNFPYERYRTISKALGADFFFWKTTEYDKLIETLQQMSDSA
jgi:DNA-binding NarL/FixJ family response regulator